MQTSGPTTSYLVVLDGAQEPVSDYRYLQETMKTLPEEHSRNSKSLNTGDGRELRYHLMQPPSTWSWEIDTHLCGHPTS